MLFNSLDMFGSHVVAVTSVNGKSVNGRVRIAFCGYNNPPQTPNEVTEMQVYGTSNLVGHLVDDFVSLHKQMRKNETRTRSIII